MNNIDLMLNTPAARAVLRKHHVTASGLEGFRQGHANKGDLFMYDLMKAISPKTSVLNGDWGSYWMLQTATPADPMGPPTFDQWTAQQNEADPNKKRTAEDWLTLFAQLGATIGGVKQNVLGGVVNPAPAPDPAAKKSNTLIYVGAALLLLVVGFLIYKQSK